VVSAVRASVCAYGVGLLLFACSYRKLETAFRFLAVQSYIGEMSKHLESLHQYSRKSCDSLREIIAFDSAFLGIELVTNCEFHPGDGPST
jgi:hypothetical protein